jgi:hypothetical protein
MLTFIDPLVTEIIAANYNTGSNYSAKIARCLIYVTKAKRR